MDYFEIAGSGIEDMHPELFEVCMELSDTVDDELVLATEVYKSLAARYRNGRLADAMSKLGVGTREELLRETHRFLKWYADRPAGEREEENAEEGLPDAVPPPRNEILQSSINDTTLFVIDNIVKRTRITDRYDVMEHMCEVLEHRFGTGAKLEENLAKMHLATTKDVLNAIDLYFVMKTLYPDTVFGRKRMQAVWAPVFQECFPTEEVS